MLSEGQHRSKFFEKKIVLITGGTGSIGGEIARRLLKYEPEVVRILATDEDAQFKLEQELQDYRNVRFFLGDVRDRDRLSRAAEGADIIFHAAALKHVPLCEYNPFEAVKTNVLGTQNLIEVAMEGDADKFITISTDKAVNPAGVLGATKLLAERLTVSANLYKGRRKTAFSCVRFGNVLETRGSVLPLFRQQIERGGPVTVTDPDMTRFVMSIQRAAELVLKASETALGGETFIFKMPALRIGDLAQVMIEELAPKYGYRPGEIEFAVVGKRPGEKHYEELMTEDEAANANETEDMFVVLPEMAEQTREQRARGKPAAVKRYVSNGECLLGKKEIQALAELQCQEQDRLGNEGVAI